MMNLVLGGSANDLSCWDLKVVATMSSWLDRDSAVCSIRTLFTASSVPELRIWPRFSWMVAMALATCSRRPLSISWLNSVTRVSKTSRYCLRRLRLSLADSRLRSSRFCRRCTLGSPPSPVLALALCLRRAADGLEFAAAPLPLLPMLAADVECLNPPSRTSDGSDWDAANSPGAVAAAVASDASGGMTFETTRGTVAATAAAKSDELEAYHAGGPSRLSARAFDSDMDRTRSGDDSPASLLAQRPGTGETSPSEATATYDMGWLTVRPEGEGARWIPPISVSMQIRVLLLLLLLLLR
jgi:hypothetical protein